MWELFVFEMDADRTTNSPITPHNTLTSPNNNNNCWMSKNGIVEECNR